ncbi:MAG TPA: transglutaminase domain-containing protein [Phycisphaerae bacterium]|nr:transglutaminase domain-containing protein [Phycisphaerae bacterium]
MNRGFHEARVVRRIVTLSLWALMSVSAGCAGPWSADVGLALSKAGKNRPELERVIEHYRRKGDPQKLEAAEFLISNMPGHGYTVTALYDAEKNEIEFDALDYDSFAQARDALEALEEEHGELDFKRKRFDEDLETITADDLIENIDLAFRAWREKPWAQNLSFEAFCQYILPYRGSNEPVNSTRLSCMNRYADLPARLENPQDSQEAAELIQRDVGEWVRFSDLYYLHPTDQSFDQMNERRLGRCEDITNMMMYAMRANAIASASDYTPFWADRDNNHAWQVILDAEGRGKAGLSNRAAKIYRKTYAVQKDSLGYQKKDDEKVPRWLAGRNYMDVTSQYMETTDATVRLTAAKPKGARFAYICVFNGGDWQAIHWGELEGDRVTFTDMGRNIAYLPAYYEKEELVPAGPPFILTSEGDIDTLDGHEGSPLTIELTATTPETPDADTRIDRPMIVVKPGVTYELFVWNLGWQSLGKQAAGEQPVSFESVPGGRLLWLVEEDSRRLERIFTIEDGKQVWW